VRFVVDKHAPQSEGRSVIADHRPWLIWATNLSSLCVA